MADRPKRKVEFIESYWTGGELGSDYQWSDNHGELVRCKDCKYGEQLFTDYISCQISDENESGCHASHRPEWFCADGERRDDDD